MLSALSAPVGVVRRRLPCVRRISTDTSFISVYRLCKKVSHLARGCEERLVQQGPKSSKIPQCCFAKEILCDITKNGLVEKGDRVKMMSVLEHWEKAHENQLKN